jgi:Ca2+/Na+ antiporter
MPLRKKNKTFKREVAILLLVFFCFVVFKGDVGMVQVIVWPIFAFAMASFGLDGYAKQIKNNGPVTRDDTDRSL